MCAFERLVLGLAGLAGFPGLSGGICAGMLKHVASLYNGFLFLRVCVCFGNVMDQLIEIDDADGDYINSREI